MIKDVAWVNETCPHYYTNIPLHEKPTWCESGRNVWGWGNVLKFSDNVSNTAQQNTHRSATTLEPPARCCPGPSHAVRTWTGDILNVASGILWVTLGVFGWDLRSSEASWMLWAVCSSNHSRMVFVVWWGIPLPLSHWGGGEGGVLHLVCNNRWVVYMWKKPFPSRPLNCNVIITVTHLSVVCCGWSVNRTRKV